jgi:hypothetical protein
MPVFMPIINWSLQNGNRNTLKKRRRQQLKANRHWSPRFETIFEHLPASQLPLPFHYRLPLRNSLSYKNIVVQLFWMCTSAGTENTFVRAISLLTFARGEGQEEYNTSPHHHYLIFKNYSWICTYFRCYRYSHHRPFPSWKKSSNQRRPLKTSFAKFRIFPQSYYFYVGMEGNKTNN